VTIGLLINGRGFQWLNSVRIFSPLGVVADHPPSGAVIKLRLDKAGERSIIEGNVQAHHFSKMVLTSQDQRMRNSFVLVQWHGESSVRETSLMI
jgi:hypothetical protein